MPGLVLTSPGNRGILNRLLKKASCLFQNTKSEKCDFHFSPKINDLGFADFAEISIFRYQASKFFEFQQPVSR